MSASLRRVLAEALGTAALLATIVGSGIVTSASGDPSAQLFRHAVAVGAILVVLIAVLSPVSGAHFNPAVTLAAVRLDSLPARRAAAYLGAQVLGAVAGTVFASVTFGDALIRIATTSRRGWGVWTAEAVVTAALVVVIFGLLRAQRAAQVAPAVGLLIGVAIFSSASTGFANPAVTLARILTDSTTGIAPADVAPFIAAQLAGTALAILLVLALFPASTDRKAAR